MHIQDTTINQKLVKTGKEAGLLSLEMATVSILFWTSFVTFGLISRKIFWKKKDEFDKKVFLHFHRLVTPRTTQWMEAFSYLGSRDFLVKANLTLIGYFLFIQPHRWYRVKVPAVAISNTVMMLLLKKIFQRPRPLDPLLGPAKGLSYPSGHSMMSFSFYGLLIFLVWKYVEDPAVKRLLIGILFLLILSIGFSRIYLRVHYASDVVAGFAMGVMCLVLSLWILRKIEKAVERRRLMAFA
ncbi:MAG: phosphatase PAP2 family protein [Flavitalea sp.]